MSSLRSCEPSYQVPKPGKPVSDVATYFLPIDVSSRFGVRLQELRRQRNYTQLRVSIDFGIEPSYLRDVECGRKSASLAMLELIALGMNVPLSELLKDL